LENGCGQIFKVTKGLTSQGFSKGKLVWDETFQVNTDRLGADDTVTLKFLNSPTDDMLFLNSRLSSESSIMEFQSRTSTSAFTNAEGSFIQDPNLHGFAKI
jgi:hypothetical protein